MESSAMHPLFLRLAWADAASFDETVREWPRCGGANGSIVSEHELSQSYNNGLSKAVALLHDIKQNYSIISWADIIQMAGAIAVELTDGPKIDMVYGRKDVLDSHPKFEQKVKTKF